MGWRELPAGPRLLLSRRREGQGGSVPCPPHSSPWSSPAPGKGRGEGTPLGRAGSTGLAARGRSVGRAGLRVVPIALWRGSPKTFPQPP